MVQKQLTFVRSFLDPRALLAVCVSVFAAPELQAQEDNLAAAAQNPIADIISLPLQFNFNRKQGPNEDNGLVLNIQPVIPISFSENLNLINRLVIPYIDNSNVLTEGGVPKDQNFTGLGDIQYQGFLSPKAPTAGGWTWGLGAVIQAPTAQDDRLKSRKWAAGPGAVAILTKGPWVVGGVLYNIWSFAGDSDAPDINKMLAQPIVNYNLPSGWYLTSAPIITADWEKPNDERWVVPVGGGFGKIVKFGKQPVNMQLSYYKNVRRPTNGAREQVRFQMQFLFPK